MGTTTIAEFSRIARALQTEARRLGLDAPGYRASAARRGQHRALRRFDGTVIVYIDRWRDEHAVTGDMIDGVLATNPQLTDRDTIQAFRDALWIAAGQAVAA